MRPSSGPDSSDRRQADRRQEVGLRFDPASGRLEIGTFASDLPSGVGNRQVLNAYVELAARSRGDRVANLIDVRHADVEALAAALDLDADDLAKEIEDVLGATRAAALSMVARLRESRVIGGITKAATGAAVAGALVVGGTAVSGASGAAAMRVEAPRVVTAATGEPVIDGPLTETADGVGLIPPADEDANGTVLIPPANVDQDPQPGS